MQSRDSKGSFTSKIPSAPSPMRGFKPMDLSKVQGNTYRLGGGAAMGLFAANRISRAVSNVRYGEYGSAMMNGALAGAAGYGAWHTVMNTPQFSNNVRGFGSKMRTVALQQSANKQTHNAARNMAKFLFHIAK